MFWVDDEGTQLKMYTVFHLPCFDLLEKIFFDFVFECVKSDGKLFHIFGPRCRRSSFLCCFWSFDIKSGNDNCFKINTVNMRSWVVLIFHVSMIS